LSVIITGQFRRSQIQTYGKEEKIMSDMRIMYYVPGTSLGPDIASVYADYKRETL